MAIAYLAEDYLVGLRVREQIKSTNNVAVSITPYLSSANAYKMLNWQAEFKNMAAGSGAQQVGHRAGGQLLNAQRPADHKEISDVLLRPKDATTAFTRSIPKTANRFTSVLYGCGGLRWETIGAVLSADIQDVVDITRNFIRVLMMISIAACAMFAGEHLAIGLHHAAHQRFNERRAVDIARNAPALRIRKQMAHTLT